MVDCNKLCFEVELMQKLFFLCVCVLFPPQSLHLLNMQTQYTSKNISGSQDVLLSARIAVLSKHNTETVYDYLQKHQVRTNRRFNTSVKVVQYIPA